MEGEAIREVGLQLAGATENVQWGKDLVFKVGGKMFLCMNENLREKYSFKVPENRFLELTDQPGIAPAPYLARAHWVQIDPEVCQLPDNELEQLIQGSYELVFSKLTKKLQKEILAS